MGKEETEQNGDFTGKGIDEPPRTEIKLDYELDNTNPLLRGLVDSLSERPKDIEQILEAIVSGESTHRDVDVISGNAKGLLLEKYISFMLDRFAQGRDVVTDPIPDGSETDEYIFKIERNNLIALKKKAAAKPVSAAGYDNVLKIGSQQPPPPYLPVVLEVKSGLMIDGKQGLKSAFHPAKMNRKLSPLSSFFNTKQFGYVVVGLSEAISNSGREGDRFREMSGILVPLPITSEELGTWAKRLEGQRPGGVQS